MVTHTNTHTCVCAHTYRLGGYISGYQGTVVIVTHEEALLQVCIALFFIVCNVLQCVAVCA